MRCKVGDIVMVVACHYKTSLPQNLGRTGEIVGRGPASMLNCWDVKPSKTLAGWAGAYWIVDDAGKVYMPDDELLPINPGDLADDTETTKELENGTPQEADLHHV